MAQRRSDALTALALGLDHLACTCGGAHCPCRPERPAAPRVLIQVMIDAATLAGAGGPTRPLGRFRPAKTHRQRPLSTAEFEALSEDTRHFGDPPPEPEQPHITQLIRCTCPPF